MLWKGAAGVSSKDLLNDLLRRGRAAAAPAKFPAGRCHRFEQRVAVALRQAVLQNVYQGFLFFEAQFVGQIQHLSKGFHGCENRPVHP